MTNLIFLAFYNGVSYTSELDAVLGAYGGDVKRFRNDFKLDFEDGFTSLLTPQLSANVWRI